MRNLRMRNLLLSALFATIPAITPIAAHADISVSINIAPPELPVYVQPPIPGDGYMWTPGYWAWSPDDEDYYWVPGTWVQAPYVGALWTPGYWGWGNGVYMWHQGYWGDHIGFYGGVNYGFGYIGTGYQGGHWDHGSFAYNTAVTNVSSVHVTNVYNTTVVNNNVTRVSYNGGNGGVSAQPTASEQEFAREKHTGPVQAQLQNAQVAQHTPELRASANHGAPPVAATPTPGKFNAPNISRATEKPAPAQGNPRAPAESNHGENAPHSNPALPLPHPREDAQPQPQPHPAPQPPREQVQPREQMQPHEQPRPQPMPQQAPHPQPPEMHQPPPQQQPHPMPQEQHPQQQQQHQAPPPQQREQEHPKNDKDQHHD